MSETDKAILNVVRKLERTLQLRHGEQARGVYPWMVQAWLDFPRHEATIRKDMRRLAEAGLLERVGGFRARRGYFSAATMRVEAA